MSATAGLNDHTEIESGADNSVTGLLAISVAHAVMNALGHPFSRRRQAIL